MRLYEGTTEEFDELVTSNSISDVLSEAFDGYFRRQPGKSEVRSWRESLNYLNNVIRKAKIEKAGLILEYQLPFSSQRIDALLFGRNEDEDSAVLIELKQWSNENVSASTSEGNVTVDYGRFVKEQAHPSLQAEGYHFGLVDFVEVFTDRDEPLGLRSCVYAHNYSSSDGSKVLFDKDFQQALEQYPVYGKEDATALAEFLAKRFSKGKGLEVLGRFSNSTIKTSRKLLDHTGEMIHKQQVFTLIGDQIAAYNAIMSKAKQLSKKKTKSIVIVKGGPGTGKSVIALEVMGELMRKGQTVFHATGSSAFTNTLRQIVGRERRVYLSFLTALRPRKKTRLTCWFATRRTGFAKRALIGLRPGLNEQAYRR